MSKEYVSKIDESFLLHSESIPKSAKEKCEKIIQAYGSDLHKWVWAPNASDTKPLSPPSGFSMVVDKFSKLNPICFDPEKFFYGTSVFKLGKDAKFMDNGDSVNEVRIIKNRERIKDNMNLCIQENDKENCATMNNFNAQRGYDRKHWNEVLGNGGAFAGIFMSSERGDYIYNKNYWLVVQSGCATASVNLIEYMEEIRNQKGMSWEKFFKEDVNTGYVYELVKRNRMRILMKIAESVGIDVKGIEDINSVPDKNQKHPLLLNPTLETISNDVTFEDNYAIYHNNTIDPETSRNGIIFNENPFLGPILLKGPPTEQNEFGNLWSTIPNAFGAFPTCTGRRTPIILTRNQKNNSFENKNFKMNGDYPFTWSGSDSINNNLRLKKNVYRSRDIKFKEAEEKLGYSHFWGEISMEPLVVKIAKCSPNFK